MNGNKAGGVGRELWVKRCDLNFINTLEIRENLTEKRVLEAKGGKGVSQLYI